MRRNLPARMDQSEEREPFSSCLYHFLLTEQILYSTSNPLSGFILAIIAAARKLYTYHLGGTCTNQTVLLSPNCYIHRQTERNLCTDLIIIMSKVDKPDSYWPQLNQQLQLALICSGTSSSNYTHNRGKMFWDRYKKKTFELT